mmetsp:Transcript_9270/g.16705  ORF Transcript_9270/g.16705 Transcript_9270/m.16705 type:complete len:280 (+) Transcript_9270:92-931(+)
MASCKAIAPTRPDIGLAHAEHVPTQHAMGTVAGESTAAAAAEGSEEAELERAIKASLEQASAEDDEVARAIKASLDEAQRPRHRPLGNEEADMLAAIQASKQAHAEDKLRREAEEEADLALAARASLADHERLQHVAATLKAKGSSGPSDEAVDEEEAVTCWTLKLQSSTSTSRVPVFWRLDAGQEEVYQRVIEAITSSLPNTQGAADDLASRLVFEERYGATSREVVLTPVSVPEFLSSGSQGLLQIVLKGRADVAEDATCADQEWAILNAEDLHGMA